MSALRIFVALQFLVLAAYTIATVSSHGMNFVPVFVGDLMSMTWRGQINLDFVSYLAVTGFWVAWRHQFTIAGIVLGLVVLFLAYLAFAPYLIYAMTKAKGDAAVLLLGEQRAQVRA